MVYTATAGSPRDVAQRPKAHLRLRQTRAQRGYSASHTLNGRGRISSPHAEQALAAVAFGQPRVQLSQPSAASKSRLKPNIKLNRSMLLPHSTSTSGRRWTRPIPNKYFERASCVMKTSMLPMSFTASFSQHVKAITTKFNAVTLGCSSFTLYVVMTST